MDFFFFLLCFFVVPPTFGDNLNPQNALEIDRARSAWNFGGYHHPVKKSAYWNRPKNVAGPGSILSNRRLGSGSAPMAPYRKKLQSPSGAQQRRRQSKPYPKSSQQGRPIAKRNTNFPFPPQPSAFPQSFPTPYYNNQQMTPTSSWHRSSRKLTPRVDTIKSRFMKEDLWHLDKGESYAVKDEDLVRDNLLRNHNSETNEIDHVQNNIHEEEMFLHQLEKDAEKMVNQAEDSANHTEKENIPHHIHHHHHYEKENNATQHPKKEAHKKKPVDPNQVIPVTLPRIHNPIPLGCLLAVPVFHPIRPRHHLACLLSIPGTPSLTRRRRKRSTDLSQLNLPTQGQSQTLFQQLFGSNSRMTPVITRKHYASHVGNGKTPSTTSTVPQGNFKVPATIIAPPKFDRDEVLNMLLGSGGVTADQMGTIVATNNRYVRFGRGLPNGRGGSRQGRHLQWTTDANNVAPSSAPVKNQSPIASSSNYVPSIAKVPPPPPTQPAKKPLMHLTPASSPSYAPQITYPQPPLILNVQISPMPSPRIPSRPVINVPIQQQLSHIEQHQPSSSEQPQNHQKYNVDQQSQQQPSVNQQQQQESSTTQQQGHQSSVDQQQERQASVEQQQQYQPIVEQQQSLIKDQHLEEQTSQQPSSISYQTVSTFPPGKSLKVGKSKYIDWTPAYSGKPKPQKAYNYDYSSIHTEPSESKLHYRKVKPFKHGKREGSISNYRESINDQVDTSYFPSTGSLSDISSFDNILDYDHGSVDSTSGIDTGSNLFESSSYPTSNSWGDYQVKDGRNNGQSISYAVKTRNYKDELDSVLQDITSRERGIYSEQLFTDDYNNVYDNMNNPVSSGSIDSDNDIYSQEKYYTVKKIPEQVPDPIFISVPKENQYFSHELYDIRK